MSNNSTKILRSTSVICLWFLMFATIASQVQGVSIEEDPSEYPRSIDLFVRGSDGVALHRIPAFTTTPKGTLIAVCDARRNRGDDLPNNIDLVMRRSSDLGRSWTPSEVIVDFPGSEGAGDSALLCDRDNGRVWLLYTYAPEGIGSSTSQPGLDGPTLQLHLIHSDDEGATWSKPVSLNPQVKDPSWRAIWSSPGCGFQTPTGRLYFPVSRWSDVMASHYLTSDDQGRSWHITASAGRNTNESMAITLEDGTVMANMRGMDGKHRRMVAISRDHGISWEEQTHDAVLVDPECQASLIRYSARSNGQGRNRLLFCNPASTKRENMTIRLSYDEGKTWPISKVIWPSLAGYSCLSVLPDGSVGLFYEHGLQHSTDQLAFVRFTLEWLTNGKDKGFTTTLQPEP
jgi:sialidase-1